MLVSDCVGYFAKSKVEEVLILVLVDVGLGLEKGTDSTALVSVLILVLVDVGLGRTGWRSVEEHLSGLNPCFSGCWSRTFILLIQGSEGAS